MSTDNKTQDPMEFMRSMWSKMGFSIPGMVTPTLDVDELDKRITDMKTVENWLKMNLSSLGIAIQGLEMQRATIAAMQAMSKVATDGAQAMGESGQPNPFAANVWPWNLMQTNENPPAGDAKPTPVAPAASKAKPKDSK